MNANYEKNIKKIIFNLFIAVIFICISMNFFGCKKVSDYTTKEHIEIITKKMKNKYTANNQEFSVYPLYNQYEKVVMYMVEYSPRYFYYVEPYDPIMPFQNMQYGISYGVSRYMDISDKSAIKTIFYTEERDENGNYIEVSPYIFKNLQKQRRYIFNLQNELLDSPSYYILAVKNGKKYVNVISGELFDAENYNEQTVCVYIPFYYGSILE